MTKHCYNEENNVAQGAEVAHHVEVKDTANVCLYVKRHSENVYKIQNGGKVRQGCLDKCVMEGFNRAKISKICHIIWAFFRH